MLCAISPDISFIVIIILLAIVGVMLTLLLLRKPTAQNDNMKIEIDRLKDSLKEYTSFFLNVSKNSNDSLLGVLKNNNDSQNQNLQAVETRVKELLVDTERRFSTIDGNLKEHLQKMMHDNSEKLEQMRVTVDEKLNTSLEKRLNESFALISDRLEKVNRGLGEMQELANGVGDLKKVLTNVKVRGVWGEVQLGSLLEQMLAPNQFKKEVMIKPNVQERVDYVVIMPGKNDDNIWLPIDAKFPLEDYKKVVDASEQGNAIALEIARKSLYKRVTDEAKSIKEKYISSPKTTDFAIMYLATEGLYAEIVKDSDLIEKLQADYRITVCGPTTLTSLINCIQMGFKTVAIEKRSSEIWKLLATFKTEFVKFVELLGKTQKKLSEASNTIEDATKKSRTIEKKLKNVDMLENETPALTLIDADEEN